MSFISKVPDEPERSQYILGFPKGLNTVQDRSNVNDRNLIVATNAEIVVDGIQRRPGTTKKFDSTGGTKVLGSTPFYIKTTATRYYIRAIKTGTNTSKLQYLNGSSWSDIGSGTLAAETPVNFIQARDRLYVYNGVDALRYLNSALTVVTYTALGSPAAPTVAPTYTDTQAVTSITRSGATATLTSTAAHGYSTGDYVTVSGAAQSEYNGIFQITVTSTVVFTYTVSGTPVTPATGTILLTSGGATSYSYKITAYNATGETEASSATSITTGPATLAATRFNRITWSAVASADGYNIYGRTTTGYGYVYVATVDASSTRQYDDVGVTLNTSKLPPDQDTTGGVIGKGGTFALGRQFVFGITEGSTYHPTRLYYSGTLNFIDAFVGGTYGGGWVDISSNDGGEIIGVITYQSAIIVFKTNSIQKFYFTSTSAGGTLPAVQEITRSHGGTSFRAIQPIDNDVVYVGMKENRIAVWTLGQQANYVGDALRTNEVSIFIQNSLENIERTKLQRIASFYYKDKFGFSYTTTSGTVNTIGFVLDTRFGGWVKWDGLPMQADNYVTYDDGTTDKLYGDGNADAYTIEMFTSTINDNGSAFTTTLGTKSFNGNQFDVEKIWRNPVLWFKYISGGLLTAQVYVDGTILTGTAVLASSEAGIGAGADLAGGFLPGGMTASNAEVTANADIPKELTMTKFARSLGIYLIDTGINTQWLFMGVHILHTPLDGKPLKSSFRASVS